VVVVVLLSVVIYLLLKAPPPDAQQAHQAPASANSDTNRIDEQRGERQSHEQAVQEAPAKQQARVVPNIPVKPAGVIPSGYFLDEGKDQKVRLGIVVDIPSRLLNPSEAQYSEITNRFKDFSTETRERIRQFDTKRFTLILEDGQRVEGKYFIAISKDRRSKTTLSGSFITKAEFKPDATEKWLVGWDVSPADIEKPFSVQLDHYPQVSVPFKVVVPQPKRRRSSRL
jgi:hypothetical protein